MAITEFLLARIAEDEDLLATPTARRMIGRKIVEVPMTRIPDYMQRDRDRWSRECAAKRAIVDARHEDDTCIRILAAVYADHPDYDPAWRTV